MKRFTVRLSDEVFFALSSKAAIAEVSNKILLEAILRAALDVPTGTLNGVNVSAVTPLEVYSLKNLTPAEVSSPASRASLTPAEVSQTYSSTTSDTSAGVKPTTSDTSAGVKPTTSDTSAGVKPPTSDTSAGVKPVTTALQGVKRPLCPPPGFGPLKFVADAQSESRTLSEADVAHLPEYDAKNVQEKAEAVGIWRSE